MPTFESYKSGVYNDEIGIRHGKLCFSIVHRNTGDVHPLYVLCIDGCQLSERIGVISIGQLHAVNLDEVNIDIVQDYKLELTRTRDYILKAAHIFYTKPLVDLDFLEFLQALYPEGV